jgi:CTP:molybdopterin cytidylyltransferase MocA
MITGSERPNPYFGELRSTMAMRADAVIMAGADNDGRLAEVSGAEYEALILINGKTMLEWVLEGVLRAERVDRVIIVGPVDALSDIVESLPDAVRSRVVLVEQRGSMIDNLMAGIEQVPDSKKALALSSDIPFITGEALDGFIKLCEETPAQVHYSLVPRSVNEARFPGVQRTYINMADAVVTGGNAFMVEPGIVRRNYDVIKQALGMRKKPLALLSMLGLPFIIKYLIGRLTIEDVERKAKTWLDIVGRGVIVPYAEIGVDVDKPSDYELACRVLPGSAGS